ncbi:Chitinase A1 [Ceratobasidium theobromae]|uniref:Chitinase A1 n=1 Tax=Ceratobasidium theobromae TaxID=1582974 RepID=A0A5N5QR60_9AGAM|nr:Chitinase A1 [Ceratobasidium theobromae]
MLSSTLLSLGLAGSALARPSHPDHAPLARALQERQDYTPPASKAPVAATWYASWHAKDRPLASVSWSKYTSVTYSFALTTPNISYVNISDPDVFKDFVQTAHANNCSASISVGGWTGSRYFSSAVATAENRTEFVKTMVDLVKTNNLDGLDFDWEYPGKAGIGCNTLSANDTDNFLLFLNELRTALPQTKLSAAASIVPFVSSDLNTPSTDVSGFAKVLDYLSIMNYDIWGLWSPTVGPNAPLNDTCASASQQVGSGVSAVQAWMKAGFPADQLVLGVPSYGHGFAVAESDALSSDGTLNLYAPFNKTYRAPGDAWDDSPAAGAVDVCGNPQLQGGNWNFWGLIDGGFLNNNGTANTAGGIAYKFDECSQTPYVYNKTSQVMVSYDNAESFAAKGQFIKSTGLRGFAMWEAGGDVNDILIDSIRSAAGFPAVSGGTPGSPSGSTTAPGATSASPSATQPSSGSGSYSNPEPTASDDGGDETTSAAATPTETPQGVSATPTTSAAAPTGTGDCDDDDEGDD